MSAGCGMTIPNWEFPHASWFICFLSYLCLQHCGCCRNVTIVASHQKNSFQWSLHSEVLFWLLAQGLRITSLFLEPALLLWKSGDRVLVPILNIPSGVTFLPIEHEVELHWESIRFLPDLTFYKLCTFIFLSGNIHAPLWAGYWTMTGIIWSKLELSSGSVSLSRIVPELVWLFHEVPSCLSQGASQGARWRQLRERRWCRC